MKLALLVFVLVAILASQSHQANASAVPPPKSAFRTALVKVLEVVNKALNNVETYGNNYFLDKLQNYTQIKEWSVNIQNQVTSKMTDLLFDAFNAYVKASSRNSVETKVFSCILNQKSNILAVVKNATTENGWCNNRLAPNLTRAFQETTAASLSANAEVETYTESLESCSLEDDICFNQYAEKLTKLFSTQVSGKNGTISAALNDVIRVYKVMFGQDVPACAKKYFLSILADGARKAADEVVHCALGI